METRILKYFLTVAKMQNITRAAQELHITQPTLSRQLKQLEDELGTQLLIRGKREITLTAEGKMLEHRAQDILSSTKRPVKFKALITMNLAAQLIWDTLKATFPSLLMI